MSTLFNTYAEYYDLLYSDKDYLKESLFVQNLIRKHQIIKNADILELGCGTGKHANIFADMGYNIHGIDMSQSMIDIANKNIDLKHKDKIHFQVGDVRSVSIEKKFDVVLSLFHVVSYQVTNDDIDAMFNTVAKHLKPGGLFIFDSWYGPGVLSERPVVRIKRMKSDNLNVLRISEPIIFPNKNLVEVNFTVQIQNKSGNLEVVSEKHNMRYLFVPELEFILTKNNMNLLENVEWMSGKEIGFDTWISTFVAKKEI
jgi:SAM-dependent methyltransferase